MENTQEFNSFSPACAKYRADLIDGQYTQLVHYNSASVHRTGPKIPPFDSTRNYLFEYINIIRIKILAIFSRIYINVLIFERKFRLIYSITTFEYIHARFVTFMCNISSIKAPTSFILP